MVNEHKAYANERILEEARVALRSYMAIVDTNSTEGRAFGYLYNLATQSEVNYAFPPKDRSK